MNIKHATLQLSLKPFMQTDEDYIKKVAEKVWKQWHMLVKHAEEISILLIPGDGSEILDYTGNLDDEFNWDIYMGCANISKEHQSIRVLYRDNPPVMTHRILKTIVEVFREVGQRVFPDKLIQIGTMFDIGPEFAVSDFKYKRHTELLVHDEGVFGRFLDCTANMHADDYPYAGFPNGVPEGTPFGIFFGRQVDIYLKDLGFDYLWLSNGLGFSAQPWKTEGKIFSNGRFYPEHIEEKRNDVLMFWENFRKECPDYLMHTRGTNFTVGIDYSTDGVCAYDLYKRNFNFLPPPNSPMASINGNYGLEIIGHLSRIAELPADDYMFRYYIHDPWFKNSPWYDRYEGQPHDIYLPMSLSRINKSGQTQVANYFNVFSLDNSYGTMPDNCVLEPMPHILKAFKEAADQPAPFTWLYPVKEYTRVKDEQKLKTMFFLDWMFVDAVNSAFPMSGVVSTDTFKNIDKSIFKDSIIVTMVPYPNTDWEESVLEYIQEGGKVILVGALDMASQKIRDMLQIGIRENNGKEEFTLVGDWMKDTVNCGEYTNKLIVKELECAGLLNTYDLEKASEHSVVTQDGYLVCKGKNNVFWYRGVMSGIYVQGETLLGFPPEDERVSGGALLRTAARYFGWDIRLDRPIVPLSAPIMTISRHNNGFYFSSCFPDTSIGISLRAPYGAPLLVGYETVYKDGRTHYRFPRAEHRECRLFVESCENTVVSCREMFPGELWPKLKCRRRISIEGLKNATVRFFPESYAIGKCWGIMSETGDRYTADFEHQFKFEQDGDSYIARNVSGTLVVYMPDYEDSATRYVEEASRFE